MAEAMEIERLRQELREANDLLQVFLENQLLGAWRFQLDAPIDPSRPTEEQVEFLFDHAYLAWCNLTMARMYGLENSDQMIGARLTDFLPREDPRNVEYLTLLVKSGYHLSNHRSHEVTPFGPKVFLNSLQGFFNEKNQVVYALGMQIDITKRIEAETNLADALKREQDANRTKNEFLATFSHEVRTPLGTIMGRTHILKEMGADSKSLEVIERNCRTLLHHVDDILDITQLELGRIKLNLEDVGMMDLLQEVVDSLQHEIARKKIQLTFNCPPDAQVRGDRQRLKQIFNNLLTNAIKFTPREGQVEIAARCENGNLKVRVRDSGQGIPQAFLPHVFERFRQADSSMDRRYNGLGLGLSIVWSIVGLHQGGITAESEGEGKGATFTVKLPLINQDSGPVNTSNGNGKKRNGNGAETPKITGIKILVVEDDSDSREFLKVMLENLGGEVDTSDSAEAAFRALECWPYHVLLSDLSMPGEDGYSLIRRIRAANQLFSSIPAIALTAHVQDHVKQDAEQAGFDRYFSKPFEVRPLMEAILELFEKNNRQ